jgi:hypothetical protein
MAITKENYWYCVVRDGYRFCVSSLCLYLCLHTLGHGPSVFFTTTVSCIYHSVGLCPSAYPEFLITIWDYLEKKTKGADDLLECEDRLRRDTEAGPVRDGDTFTRTRYVSVSGLPFLTRR